MRGTISPKIQKSKNHSMQKIILAKIFELDFYFFLKYSWSVKYSNYDTVVKNRQKVKYVDEHK